MLPTVLEIHVLWHPADSAATAIATDLAEHFHGGPYASLLSGAVEVYVRSAPWRRPDDAPRPIPWPTTAFDQPVVTPASHVAVVPIVGIALARAFEDAQSAWRAYLSDVFAAQRNGPARVGIFPMRVGKLRPGSLASHLPTNQFLGEPDARGGTTESLPALRRRDLAQGIAQWLSGAAKQLRVFISHTKRDSAAEDSVDALLNSVRDVLQGSRVAAFYDAHDLQPGEDWDRALRKAAGSSALLAVRTDLYSSRTWCQREMLLAKVHGMPVVVLDALTQGEVRGSFLMDHTPRIPARGALPGTWDRASIERAIGLLADAWLHRVLWQRQRDLAREDPRLAAYWWAPQAPEPTTMAQWLGRDAGATADAERAGVPMPPPSQGEPLRILYPDPPLAEDECRVLERVARLAGYAALDLTTPRLLSARGA